MGKIIKIEKKIVERGMLFDMQGWLTLDVNWHWMKIDIGCCLTWNIGQ